MLRTVFLVSVIAITTFTISTAQDSSAYIYGLQTNNKLKMLFYNMGVFYQVPHDIVLDPLTGLHHKIFTYPPESGGSYLAGHITIGGIVNSDTLSTRFGSFELTTDPSTFGYFGYQTKDNRQSYYSHEARSELDLVCQYLDTVIKTPFSSRFPFYPENKHTPLNIKIRQRSMAWSSPPVDDFILVSYELENIGKQTIEQVFVGLGGNHSSNFNPSDSNPGCYVGHLKDWPSIDGCNYRDTVGISYIIDTDGRFSNGEWSDITPKAGVGMRLLEAPSDAKRRNYNWWTPAQLHFGSMALELPWGPRQFAQPGERFRDFGHGLGFPYYDNNYYYLMSKREFDYDQMFAAVDHTAEGFLPPHGGAVSFATNSNARNNAEFVYSFGSFDLPPGARAEFTIAIVAGDSIHVNPDDYKNLFDPANPTPYYNSLDFSQLANNAR
ncbi:MAG: hypothetical protein SGI97_03580, partial [candidate division Zixibacteria bacterium]|nr:hypothetical protein [candidate division Zixibacteria bacterium]